MEHSKIQDYKESGYRFDESKSFGVDEIEGKELWLIKIPKDLPFESIPNKISVQDYNKVSVKSLDINKKKYTIHQDDTNEISTLFNAWSKNKDHGKMALGKPFTKFIQIDELVTLPKTQYEVPPIQKPKQQHELLKGVYDPPGSSGYLKKVAESNKNNINVKSKQTKSNTTKTTTTTTAPTTATTTTTTKKDNKNKKQKEESEEEESEEESSSEEEDKKSKKKSSKKSSKDSKKEKKSSSKKSKKDESSSESSESESESSEEDKKSKKKSSSKDSKKDSKKSSSKKSKKEESSSESSESEPEKKKKEKRKKDESSDSSEQTKKKHKK